MSATSVSGGLTNPCAIGIDGSLHCWGIDFRYPASARPTPVRIPGGPAGGLRATTHVGFGGCALEAGGGSTPLWCWGPGLAPNTLTQLPNLVVRAVTVGWGGYTCIITRDEQVACATWQELVTGQFQPLASSQTYRQVDVAGYQGSSGCAVRSDARTVDCWGRHPALKTTDMLARPLMMTSGEEIRDLSVGGNDICVVVSSGRIECLGAGYSTYASVRIPGTNIIALPNGVAAADIEYTDSAAEACALSDVGRLFCWGSGWGPTGEFIFPPTELPSLAGVRFTQLSSDGDSFCGLTTQRTVQCWDFRFTAAEVQALLGGTLQTTLTPTEHQATMPIGSATQSFTSTVAVQGVGANLGGTARPKGIRARVIGGQIPAIEVLVDTVAGTVTARVPSMAAAGQYRQAVEVQVVEPRITAPDTMLVLIDVPVPTRTATIAFTPATMQGNLIAGGLGIRLSADPAAVPATGQPDINDSDIGALQCELTPTAGQTGAPAPQIDRCTMAEIALAIPTAYTGGVFTYSLSVSAPNASGVVVERARLPITLTVAARTPALTFQPTSLQAQVAVGAVQFSLSADPLVQQPAGQPVFTEQELGALACQVRQPAGAPVASVTQCTTAAIQIGFASPSIAGLWAYEVEVSAPQSALPIAPAMLPISLTVQAPPPVTVRGATLQSGLYHLCALGPVTGRVSCVGANTFGELGIGSVTSATSFTLASTTQLYDGMAHGSGRSSCALTTAGAAWCWGLYQSASVGSLGLPMATVPVAVGGGYTFTSLSAGQGVTCGATASGAAYCWGKNLYGELGIGVAATSGSLVTYEPTTPVQLSGAKVVGAGNEYACALTNDALVFCWGRGELLGAGPRANGAPVPLPVALAGSRFYTDLVVGFSFSCALQESGAAWCWGGREFGKLGDGHVPDPNGDAGIAYEPVEVRRPANVAFVQMAVGPQHACALDVDGRAWCWGDNSWNQLGDGTAITRGAPVAVNTTLRFTELAASAGATCGRSTTGALHCWGIIPGLFSNPRPAPVLMPHP